MVPFEALHENVLEFNPGPVHSTTKGVHMWKLISSQTLLAKLFSLTLSSWRKRSLLLCIIAQSTLLALTHRAASTQRGKFIAKLHTNTVHHKRSLPMKRCECVWRRWCCVCRAGGLLALSVAPYRLVVALAQEMSAPPGENRIRDEFPLIS